jgi:ABC-type Fe3+-hydroxamate transport system substrate-binding protein
MPVEPATKERADELKENYDEVLNEVEQATSKRGGECNVSTLMFSICSSGRRADGAGLNSLDWSP